MPEQMPIISLRRPSNNVQMGASIIVDTLKTTDPVLMQRRQSQIELINSIRNNHADKTVVVPWLTKRPTGTQALKELVNP